MNKIIKDRDNKSKKVIKEIGAGDMIAIDPGHCRKNFEKAYDNPIDETRNITYVLNDERIKKIYAALLHDREQDSETKIKKWKGMLAHFIASENSETIENLKELIKELTRNFLKVDANYSTNICESFHHSRALLANKNIAWRLSWQMRAFISVIKWNCDNWVEKMYKEFYLLDIKKKKKKKKQERQKGKLNKQ